ncbi:MAG: xdhB, partial [Polaromonas sp.]|nr:xdhB [Polaromonas sp.]
MDTGKDISLSRDEVADPQVTQANDNAAEVAEALAVAQPAPATRPPVAQVSGSSRPHESARAQVAGAASYVDDIPEIKGTLHAAPILSTVAHGRLLRVDTAAALAMPGVRDVILAQDIPGDRLLGNFSHDEPVFAQDTVQHIGQ